MAISGLGQPQMLAEGRAFIVGTEQATRLKDGDDLVHEQLQLPRQRLKDDEAVGRTAFEPALQAIGDCVCRPDKSAARRCQSLHHLPQRQILRAYLRQYAERAALLAVEADMFDIGKGSVEIILAEIMVVEGARQEAKPRVERFQRRQFPIARFGILVRVADDRGDAGQDEQLAGVATKALRPDLDVGIIGLACLFILGMGEDDLGPLRREVAAFVRRAGLENDRLALRRAFDVERAAHLEEFTLMIEPVQPVGVDELPARLVPDMGAVFPTVPQPLHHVEIFARYAIAHRMGRMFGLAEIGGGIGQPGGDDVPARATTAQVIERGELTGDVERLGIADRQRGDQTDARRRRRQCR